MKKIVSTLVVAAVVAGGFLGWRVLTVKNIHSSIGTQLHKVETAYQDITKESALPLYTLLESSLAPVAKAEPNDDINTNAEELAPETEQQPVLGMTDAQRQAWQRVSTSVQALGKGDLEARVVAVQELQNALQAFYATLADAPWLAGNASLINFRHEIGERGDVRELIEGYNQAVRLWANAIENPAMQWMLPLTGLELKEYAYLRFDGQTESEQQINFGQPSGTPQ